MVEETILKKKTQKHKKTTKQTKNIIVCACLHAAVSERTRKNSNSPLNQCFRERTPIKWGKGSQIFKGSAREYFTFMWSIHSGKIKE